MDAPRHADALLEELDEARRRLFAKCGNDPERVFEWFLEYQKKYADCLISRHQQSPRGKSAA